MSDAEEDGRNDRVYDESLIINSAFAFFLGIRIELLNRMLCLLLGKKRLLPIALMLDRSLVRLRYSFSFVERRCLVLSIAEKEKI